MIITDKDKLKDFSKENRIWQGIPSMERTKNGRLFCVYYSGHVKEALGNYVILAVSDDDGKTWVEPAAVCYAGKLARCFDSELWIDPRGRLWWTWSVFPVSTVWASVCDDPDAEELVWSEPRCIGGEVMMTKPIVTSDGRWLFPMTTWKDGLRDPLEPKVFGQESRAYVWQSPDEGKTFRRLGGADVPERCYDEQVLLEKKDGSLEMLVRTAYGVGKSVSHDGGSTWSQGEDSGIPSPCSRIFMTRLQSGNVLLVRNMPNAENPMLRERLAAFLSADDGETWSAPLVLDERQNVSYPDGVERGGEIWITYDRERGGYRNCLAQSQADAREVLMCRFTEADVLAGRMVSPGSCAKITVSKLGAYAKDDAEELYAETLWNPADFGRTE